MRRNLFWLIALVVVVSLSGGTAYAAHKYVVSSSTQVKNGALSAADLSKKARASLRGNPGPRGHVGPSQGYDLSISATPLPVGQPVEVGSVQVPAGTYLAFARIQIQTNPAASAADRLDCNLSLNDTWLFDTATFQTGSQASTEQDFSLQGGTEDATGGLVRLDCSAAGHSMSILAAKITVLRVGAMSKLPLD